MLRMKAEGGRTKLRLDKFRRGGRRAKRYDNGGPAGCSAASTSSADDPGGELATATKERKGTLGRIQDELLGPKSAYKRGGRPKHRGYDAGGATPRQSRSVRPRCRTSPSHPAKSPCGMIQSEMPPLDTAGNYGGAGSGFACPLQKNALSFPGSPPGVPVPAVISRVGGSNVSSGGITMMVA